MRNVIEIETEIRGKQQQREQLAQEIEALNRERLAAASRQLDEIFQLIEQYLGKADYAIIRTDPNKRMREAIKPEGIVGRVEVMIVNWDVGTQK